MIPLCPIGFTPRKKIAVLYPNPTMPLCCWNQEGGSINDGSMANILFYFPSLYPPSKVISNLQSFIAQRSMGSSRSVGASRPNPSKAWEQMFFYTKEGFMAQIYSVECSFCLAWISTQVAHRHTCLMWGYTIDVLFLATGFYELCRCKVIGGLNIDTNHNFQPNTSKRKKGLYHRHVITI